MSEDLPGSLTNESTIVTSSLTIKVLSISSLSHAEMHSDLMPLNTWKLMFGMPENALTKTHFIHRGHCFSLQEVPFV